MRLPFFRADDTRSVRTQMIHLVKQALALARLPGAVRWFYVRALWTAWRHKDQYSFDVVARPDDLGALLKLADEADVVVELGTATAWTAVSLALARGSRRVTTYDPVKRPQRELYLGLVGEPVRERIAFVHDVGRSGPRRPGPVEFLFVDGSHQLEDTILTFHAWQDAIGLGGRVVFHDYLNAKHPGVTEAIRQLRLKGQERGRLFVWTRE